MKIFAFTSCLYRLLLLLYPVHFRSEYAEEMSDVFTLRMEQSFTQGGLNPIRYILHEFSTLPFSLLRVHWHAAQRFRKKVLSHGY